jgi:hypothetical protein
MAFHIVAYMIYDNACDDDGNETPNKRHFDCEKWSTGFLYDRKTKIVQVAYSV